MATVQVIMSGTFGDGSTTVVSYTNMMGGGTSTFTTGATSRQSVMPVGGNFKNFQVQVQTAPGSGKSWTFMVMRNGVTTTLEVVIADTATVSSIDTDSAAFSAEDLVQIRCTPSGTPTAAASVYWSCEWVPTTDNDTIFLGHTESSNPTDAVWLRPIGGGAPDTIETDAQILMPTAGTIDKFYVDLQAVPGAGTTRAFTVYKNGIAQTLTVSIADTSSQGNDSSNSFTVVAGDRVVIFHEYALGIPASSITRVGMRFVPTVSGEFIVCGTTDDALNSAATEYTDLTHGDTTLTATEAEQSSLCVSATTAKKIYVWLHIDPGSAAQGDAYSFTLRDDVADTALLVQITADNTTGNATTDVSIAAGSLLSTKIVPINVPSGNPKTSIAYLFATPAAGGGVVESRLVLLGVG
jgi:hypothetical protein